MYKNVNVFDEEEVDALRGLVRTLSWKNVSGELLLSTYTEIDASKLYIMGITCSSGIDDKNSTIVILDPKTEELVAELVTGSDTSILRLYKAVCFIMKEFTPNALICIDRNASNIMLIRKLEDSPFKHNIYYDTDNLRASHGVHVSTSTRRIMLDELKDYIYNYKGKLLPDNIIKDISEAVYIGYNTKYGNSLASYLLALYITRHGEFLSDVEELKFVGSHRGISEVVKNHECVGGDVQQDTEACGKLNPVKAGDVHIPYVQLRPTDREDSLRHGVSMAEGKTSKHINRPDTPSISDASDVDTRMIVNPVSEQDALIKIAPETQDEEPLEYYGGVQFIQARPEIINGQQGYSIMSYTDIESDIFKKINSWVPQDIFNNRFSKNGEFSFSHALQALKRGHDVARSGWNGTDMYITIIKAGNAAHKGLPMQDCLALKNNRGEMQPGWVPSQGDMLALDWRIVK